MLAYHWPRRVRASVLVLGSERIFSSAAIAPAWSPLAHKLAIDHSARVAARGELVFAFKQLSAPSASSPARRKQAISDHIVLPPVMVLRIAAASCFLPLTKNPSISRELGTRHRAAIGITEDTDAISVVVSEETGLISFIDGGQVKRHLDTNQLRSLLLMAMEIPIIERKREQPKTMKESESEITLS